MRPDSCYRVDQHPRRAVELAIPLAGNGRRGSGGDQGDTTFRVRAGVRHAGVPARQPRLGGRGPGHGGPPRRPVAVAGSGAALARGHRPRWPDRGVGVWHRRRRVTRLPAGRTAAVAVGHHDEPTRMAAVISGPVIMHTYLVAHVSSSTISELTLWSSGPPQVPWPTVADSAVLDALTAPLCEAYIGSCP